MNPNGMYEKILLTMREGRFPVARFELHNDAEKELVMTALDNIYTVSYTHLVLLLATSFRLPRVLQRLAHWLFRLLRAS